MTAFFAIATFKNIAGFSSEKPTALWIVEFIFTLACVIIYIVLQLVLVVRTLDDRWPIGDIIFGTAFFVIGQVILYGFSVTICDAVSHYIDGLFFSTLCTLFAVMMVYKFWDSLTAEVSAVNLTGQSGIAVVEKGCPRGEIAVLNAVLRLLQDLEFAVGKSSAWEVKESLMDDYAADSAGGSYPPTHR